MNKKKLISIFTPVFNEEDNIVDVYETVKSIMLTVQNIYDYEHIFSDNASTDNSIKILKRICEDDKNIKVISLSKNFGVTRSTLNGLYRCKGDAVIQLDADLQDPPEMILQFLTKWEEGNKVVFGIRKDRDENWIMKNIRKLFYRIASNVSNEKLIPDVGEFRLMDKQVINELRHINDQNPYLRGIIANIGFNQIGIPYNRLRRNKGKTKANLFNLFDYGMNGIISHSTILLRLSTITGIIIALISFGLIIVYVILKLIMQNSPPGTTSLMIFILFFSGVQMIFLGIIGEYIAKIFKQSMGNSLVIEQELINFDN